MKQVYESLKTRILEKVPEIQDVRLFNNQIQNMENGTDTLYLPSVLIQFEDVEYGHKNHLNQYGKATVKFHIVTEDYNSSPEIAFELWEKINRTLNRYSDGTNYYPLERTGEEHDTDFTNVYVYVIAFELNFIHYLSPESNPDTASVQVDLMITEQERTILVPTQDEPAKIVQGDTVFYLDRNNTYTFPEYSEINHTHPEYALKSDLDTIDMSSKADVGHTHDDRYYTQSQVDNKIINITTNLDWKGSVATYADLATTYPAPSQGWTVTVNDTQNDYRYDGSQWVDIGNNSSPMASPTVDGRMSKEHYQVVNNLTSTYSLKSHTHSATDITSGTLSDSRLSSNIPQLNSTINVFTGGAEFTSLKVGGTLLANTTSTNLNATVDLYDIPASEITKLENNANWTGNNYTGTPIINTYQGQEYNNATHWFKCVSENQWIRR